MLDRLLALARAVTGRFSPDLDDGSPEPSEAARVVRFGVALTVLAVAGQSVVHLANVVFFDLSHGLLNADADGSVFSWASTVATFAAAGLLALLAAFRPERATLLLLLAAAVAYLSLDDAVQLHERVSEWKTQLGPLTHFSRTFWPLVYMPLLAAVFVGLATVATGLRRRHGRLVMLALVMLAVAVLLEMASPLLFELGFDHGDLGYEWEAVTEEGLELGGWMLISVGLGAALCSLATRDRASASTTVVPGTTEQ